MTTHKRTMFILEQKYGNDGYAFWFKLLEVLGGTENHVFDTRNTEDMMFLVSKTRLNEDICLEILNLLSSLKAIDSDLWGSGLIWCQNFVDGVADVYKKRKREVPIKPSLRSPNQEFSGQKLNNHIVSGPETSSQPDFSNQPVTESTQRRGEESKEKERRGDPLPPNNYQIPDEEVELITQKIILWNKTFSEKGIIKKIPTDDINKRGILMELMEFTLEDHQKVYDFALSPRGWANERMRSNLTFKTVHKNFIDLLERANIPVFENSSDTKKDGFFVQHEDPTQFHYPQSHDESIGI